MTFQQLSLFGDEMGSRRLVYRKYKESCGQKGGSYMNQEKRILVCEDSMEGKFFLLSMMDGKSVQAAVK
mgnify:CR=1 FL=1